MVRILAHIILLLNILALHTVQAQTNKSHAGNKEGMDSLLEVSRKNYEKYIETGDSASASEMLRKMAWRYVNTMQISEALKTYDNAIKMASASGNDTTWAKSMLAKTTIYEITSQPFKAIKTARTVIQSPKAKPVYHRIAFVNLSNNYRNLGHLDSALIFLDSAQNKKIENPPPSLNNLHTNYGILYLRRNQYNKALTHYLAAIEDTASINNAFYRLNNYIEIANLYHILNQDDKAREYIEQSISLSKKKGVDYNLYKSFYVLGQIEYAENNIDSAIQLLDSSYQYFLAKKRNSLAFQSATNLVRAYWGKERYKEAEQLLEEIDSLENLLKNKSDKIARHLLRFDYHIRNDELAESKEMLDEAKRLSTDMESPYTEKSISDRYALWYKKRGKFAEAYQALTKSNRLKDSINQLSQARMVNEIQNKYEKAQNEQRIKALTLENQLKEITLQQERTKTWLALGLSLICLLLLTVIYFQYQKIKRQNDVISKTLNERETLLKEIHHRVKNNLQVISSLLYLQAEHIKDKNAISALKEGRNRVKSMSLIHQNLYQEGDLIGVNTKTYFEKLIRSLFNSYNIDTKRINVDTTVESLELDENAMVPLALIVNELISNSLKHAFPEGKKGNIQFEFLKKNGTLELKQSDDGIGFNGEWKDQSKDSFGYQLISILSRKLDAEIQVNGENGFEFHLACKIEENA